jgi:hypothetical protein
MHISKAYFSHKNGALPVVTVVERTAWTTSEDAAVPDTRVNSKRRLKAPRPSLMGLLLILSQCGDTLRNNHRRRLR